MDGLGADTVVSRRDSATTGIGQPGRFFGKSGRLRRCDAVAAREAHVPTRKALMVQRLPARQAATHRASFCTRSMLSPRAEAAATAMCSATPGLAPEKRWRIERSR